MFSNRLASHLERGVVGFPTTLASSVGLIMASPVILTVQRLRLCALTPRA